MADRRVCMAATLRALARAPARTARRHLLDDFLAGADIDPALIDPVDRQQVRAELLNLEGLPAGIGTSPQASRRLYEAVIGGDDTLPRRFLTLGERAARPVGRIAVPMKGGNLYGTGLLVGHRLLLTNHHVLASAEQARRAHLLLGHYEGPGGAPSSERCAFPLDPGSFFWTNAALDYSLVGVHPESDGLSTAHFGRIDLLSPSGKALIGERVNIVHHPGGRPQAISIRENRVADVFDQWIHYVADTSEGSSGAAVFNDEWQLVALHHAAVPYGEEGVVNEGIRISAILEDLAQSLG